jgi:dihydroorotase
MKVIIREAKIIDAQSSYHNKVVDLQIAGNTIEKMGTTISAPADYVEVKLPNLHLSQGWFDSSVSFGEPGFEDRETLANGIQVAAKSGFTAVALQPNTQPVVDNQAQVLFIKAKSQQAAVTLHPIGALTKNAEGQDMAELFDMKNAGAVAFGDYAKNCSNANVLKIALQYVQDFDGLVIAFSQDENIKGKGFVNEGATSIRLGMKGIPLLAEEMIVARNLFLLEYTGGKMHIPTLSSPTSLQLIQEAKAKGLQVTCSVAVHHLALNDSVLETFDTRYKVNPPIQSETTRKALVNYVLDGTIDCVTSDHYPMDIEHKKMEFDLAKNGTIGLESAFGALHSLLSLEKTIETLTAGKSIFQLPSHPIEVGNTACLTLFNPDIQWTFESKNILSKSKNSAFLNQPMKGKAYGIYNNSKLICTHE